MNALISPVLESRLFDHPADVYYAVEPIVELHGHGIRGHELLLRRCTPASPDDWAAWHRYLGHDVLPRLLRAATAANTWVAVNLNTAHIIHDDIDAHFGHLAGFPLMFEWTEWTETMATHEETRAAGALLQTWRTKYGFRLAVDDLGAGQDAMQRLLAARPDVAKIDGPLMHQARDNDEARLCVHALADIAIAFGTQVVAEWIESERDVRLAMQLGAHYGQGRHFTPCGCVSHY